MTRLRMLHVSDYVGVNRDDPIRFYSIPVLGRLYRRRVELCLAELNGGDRILEVGFGSGVTFLNLSDLYREIHGLDLTADVGMVHRFFQERGIETFLRNGSVLQLPYPDNCFDAVLLISILEHLQPQEQPLAFHELARVVKPEGQVVYGAPMDRPIMALFFRMLGYNIHEHHGSNERDISSAARSELKERRILRMCGPIGLLGGIYEVGHFFKER